MSFNCFSWFGQGDAKRCCSCRRWCSKGDSELSFAIGYKASSSAKSTIWKLALFTLKFWNKTNFPMKAFASRLWRFETEAKANSEISYSERPGFANISSMSCYPVGKLWVFSSSTFHDGKFLIVSRSMVAIIRASQRAKPPQTRHRKWH